MSYDFKAEVEKINYDPLSDYIILDPVINTLTKGGIALPDGVDTEPQMAYVLKVGPGRISEDGVKVPIEGVQAGDKVVLSFLGLAQPIELAMGGKQRIVARVRELMLVERK